MALIQKTHTIVWSPKAVKTFDSIIGYLQKEFSDKEVQRFIRKTNRILELIALDPKMFRSSEKEKHKHIVVLSTQTTFYYRHKPNKKEIELLLFWATRKNPDHLRY